MQMVFGYGSLVNRATHALQPAYRASVTGWRRAWRPTGLRRLAFLTAEPDPGGRIEGLIAGVPGGDWGALDDREFAYLRHPVPPSTLLHEGEARHEVQIYAVPPEDRDLADHPILLSYLDVVIQGFAREFGAEGAERFFDTTHGWEAPVIDDRAAPLYPRSQRLTAEETALVDAGLARVGAQIVRD